MGEFDQVKPGCEPFAAEGSGENARIGVLLIHGFTGSPDSTVPWAKHLSELGYRVNAIRLPGHGTTWQDANTKRLSDLRKAAADAFEEMLAQCDKVFVFAQSFGATLALQLAGERPEAVAGLALVNPWVRADGVASWQKHLAPFQRFLPYLTKSLPGVASDIADPASSGAGLRPDPRRARRRHSQQRVRRPQGRPAQGERADPAEPVEHRPRARAEQRRAHPRPGALPDRGGHAAPLLPRRDSGSRCAADLRQLGAVHPGQQLTC